MLPHADHMRRAILMAQAGIHKGQSPFGAVVVRGDQLVAEGHNCVWLTTDPTAHAEVVAIRQAATALQAIDLSGCVMYTTCEPCPMCLSAIHWSKIAAVYYGATIADAQSAGFSELCFPAKELARQGGSQLRVESGVLQAECADLFRQWQASGRARAY